MFKVNDYVVYSRVTGVCRIIDIRKEQDISDNETEYYILQPVFDKSIIIKAPTNNSYGLLRNIITKDAALALMATMPKVETVWIKDDRQRNEIFRNALKTGEYVDLVKVIKAVYQEKKAKAAVGKKMRKSDEAAMKMAEKQLHEEFALALNISPDEVISYITGYISQSA